jgi:hypothetical protein
VTRRSRLVSHALCIADVPDGQTYLPMRGGRCGLFRVPSRTGCQVSLRSMLPNPRLQRPGHVWAALPCTTGARVAAAEH